MTQIGKCWLKMQAQGVVNLAGHAGLAQGFSQCVAKEAANCELIIDMMEFSGRRCWTSNERAEITGVKETAIAIGVTAARMCPGIQVIELDAKDGSLQGVQAAVRAEDVMEILLLTAMDSEDPQAFCQGGIIRGD